MKKVLLSIWAVSAVMLASCGGGNENENTVTEETPAVAETITYTADPAATQVNWKGEVIGVYGHEGYVNLKSGSLEMQGDKLVGGEFVVDMTNIVPTDSSSYGKDEGTRITDLQGHLAADDFFATATYPTSTFTITSVEGNKAMGNLTVRDKTHEETLEIENLNVTPEGVTMTGKLVFDRHKYDVNWEHFVKDYILSDDIVITYTVVLK